MDALIKTTKEEEFDNAISYTPDEVLDFMWSSEFDDIINSIQKILLLSDSEKNIVKKTAYNLTLRLDTLEDAVSLLSSNGIDTEKITKILYIIQEMILVPASKLALELVEDVNEESIAPSPSDMLARLSETMIKPTTLAPTKRDYSADMIQKNTVKSVTAEKTIDPYRELPEK